MTPYEQLLEDLAAEHAALDAVLGGMTDAQWDLPSHAPGWLVRESDVDYALCLRLQRGCGVRG
jgi:hypothetical protein